MISQETVRAAAASADRSIRSQQIQTVAQSVQTAAETARNTAVSTGSLAPVGAARSTTKPATERAPSPNSPVKPPSDSSLPSLPEVESALSHHTPSARLLYLHLLDETSGGVESASQRDVHRRVELSETTVRGQLAKLESVGFTDFAAQIREA